MRLTCPNCSAQYEVPDEVIPEEGRDVQCSNCDQTWFQAKHPTEPADAPADEAETPEQEDAPADAAEVQPDTEPDAVEQPVSEDKPEVEEPAESTGNVDPSVANILKEEAAREAELRAQEGSSLESQPDLGLDPPPEPKVRPKRPSASETAVDAGQKDALPDVEAINSTMRSDEADEAVPTPRKSGGFLRGFALMLIIGVVLYLIYGNAQQIGEAVPQADPILSSYVSLVDQARIWLEAQAGSGAQN